MPKETQHARPYAIAAFEYAQEHHALPEWLAMLHILADIVAHPVIRDRLDDPQYSADELNELMLKIAHGFLDVAACNFLKLLANAHRLSALPDILSLFQLMYAKVNQELDVEVVSAVALSDAYKQKLSQTLKARFKREPLLHCRLDESLIGGLVIRAGDDVIDASIKGQLTKLKDYVVGEICN